MSPFVYLFIAIIAEIIGTNALKLSEGFTKLVPSIVVALGYGIAFYFLSLTLKSLPIGLSYAIWSAVGTVGTVLVGVVVWRQPITWVGVLAMILIVVGVVLLNLSSGEAHT